MQIDFKISNYPKELEGPIAFSQIEGKLSIVVNDAEIFSQNGMLLLEFAKFLSNWILQCNLNNGPVESQYYSMDIEGGPILEILKDQRSQLIIHSIWSTRTFTVEFLDMKLATISYISRLTDELKQCGLDVRNYLESYS